MAQIEYEVSEDDLAFIAAFESCRMTETEWTHLAHVRVAWICLALAEPAAALERIGTGILRFNTKVLERRLQYHQTVTEAFTRLVCNRMKRGENWNEFSRRIDDFLSRERPILREYYSAKVLASKEARVKFVEPDIRPLPTLERAD